MRKSLTLAVAVALMLPLAAPLAALSKADRKEAKKMFQGTLYLRMDAPCATGRHAYGTYKRPLIEVSPEGSASPETQTEVNASWWHADSTYWGIRINDPVELDELDFDEDVVEAELEGVGPAEDNVTVIKLTNINSLDDLQKAFDHAFARKPLQDEHEDWPADIKEAIANRQLKDGMTRRQAYYITGTPKSFDKQEVDGKEVETWMLRQDLGMKLGYWGSKAGETTGLPASIRFEDGVLVDAAETGTSSDFKLD